MVVLQLLCFRKYQCLVPGESLLTPQPSMPGMDATDAKDVHAMDATDVRAMDAIDSRGSAATST